MEVSNDAHRSKTGLSKKVMESWWRGDRDVPKKSHPSLNPFSTPFSSTQSLNPTFKYRSNCPSMSYSSSHSTAMFSTHATPFAFSVARAEGEEGSGPRKSWEGRIVERVKVVGEVGEDSEEEGEAERGEEG
jgi:hypothetical protein